MKAPYKVSLIVIALVTLGVLLWYIYGMNRVPKIVNKSEVESEIKDFGYKINDNESTYYKETFKELESLLSSKDYDDNTYRDLIAKLFVIDLYSLDTKINKYEVSSVQYFYPERQEMHQNKVIDNFYNIIEDNSYGKRTMDLPVVSNTEVLNTEEVTYTIDDVEYPGVKTDIEISYEKDLGYDKKGSVTLIKKDNKWWVVSFEGSEEV